MREIDAILLETAKQEISSWLPPSSVTSAFEHLLLRYEKLIYHIALRYFANPEDALDASQEAAVKIYKGISRVAMPENGSLKAWICTVTANTCLDLLRKKRPQTTEFTDETVRTSLPSAEDTAADNEQMHQLLTAINKLPDNLRMVLILRDMQGLSYEELSTALQINVGTVKSRLFRARATLKDALVHLEN